MDNQLISLTKAIKEAFNIIHPDKSPLSYVLMIGHPGEGKTALLKQSKLKAIPLDLEEHISVYYNPLGVIVELSEKWIYEREALIQDTLKALNKVNASVSISGIALCVDIQPFLEEDSAYVQEKANAHGKFLKKIASALPDPVPLSIFFTKMDNFSGFCEFFHYEHTSELKRALGFSLPTVSNTNKLKEIFALKFEQFTEVLNQQTLQKLHHARSHMKRTLIREFPLKLADLNGPIQNFLQALPRNNLMLQAIYFTCAEQGGVSIDPLNKKISKEYALVLQDRYIQSNNFKAYFIEGAIRAFQTHTKQHLQRLPDKYRYLIGSVALATGLGLSYIVHHHIHTKNLLDDASKELLRYENLMHQGEQAPVAIFHLHQAQMKLEQAAKLHRAQYIKDLSHKVTSNTTESIQTYVLPKLLSIIEDKLASEAQSPAEKFKTLKIYLMLADESHHQKETIIAWFEKNWPKATNLVKDAKEKTLLMHMLERPLHQDALNAQLIMDVRNYLNTLPQGFILYTMAKEQFPNEEQKLDIKGFTLIHPNLPYIYTKRGYDDIIKKLPNIAQKIEDYHWVLNDNPSTSKDVQLLLEQAYAIDYTSWWQNFMETSFPTHYQNYRQGSQEVKTLSENNAIEQFLNLIQQETGPDLNQQQGRFNQDIASQFTDINLISKNIQNELAIEIQELERFLTTLAVVNDGGRTAFNITRTRFLGTNASDPLSILYARAQRLPAPLSKWTRQLADEATTLLINEARNYINLKWQRGIYVRYQNQIQARYPFDEAQHTEVSLNDFNAFFNPQGQLNQFTEEFIKPFIDINSAEWTPKTIDGFVMPISKDTIDELMRANVITTMFFPGQTSRAEVEFSLQKLNLDPILSHLELKIGREELIDTPRSESISDFSWPQTHAKLLMTSIEGNRYQLQEQGPWGIFRLLQKMNVIVDENDSSSLEVVFDIKGYTGHYLLRAQNQINPFIPGILSGFSLPKSVV